MTITNVHQSIDGPDGQRAEITIESDDPADIAGIATELTEALLEWWSQRPAEEEGCDP